MDFRQQILDLESTLRETVSKQTNNMEAYLTRKLESIMKEHDELKHKYNQINERNKALR